MYLRPCKRAKRKRSHVYWELVESVRTERGPRQRVVAYLGDMAGPERVGVRDAAEGGSRLWQRGLYDEELEPEWVEVDTRRVVVENARDFGGWWLGLTVLERLGLVDFLARSLPSGREEVPWWAMALVLVLSRLNRPSSELAIAERWYERSALRDLLGVPAEKVNDDRLYRALDALLEKKEELEAHLMERLGELFSLEYDLLLYDVTSTYFEGLAEANEDAAYGYSRDHRSDCKQVCIALVVTRSGMPLSYEVFAGNRADVTTVEEVVTKVEARFGKADRIWVMDRGMVSEANLRFLREGDRRYIVGTPKGQLKRFERELVSGDWELVRDGLEVKLCPSPEGDETFILCRSRDRSEKERAIHTRFERKIEEGLERIARGCEVKRCSKSSLERRVGALLHSNSRAAGLFSVRVEAAEACPERSRGSGGFEVTWRKDEARRAWWELADGCYMLRSNVTAWSAEELWRAYVQLTEAEAAFRIQKNDLRVRPVWHQKAERVRAHILVCFLAYVVWKTLAELCSAAGLGDEPRRVFEELSQIKVMDVVLRTRTGTAIRRRCVTQPTRPQAALLSRLHMRLPRQMRLTPETEGAAAPGFEAARSSGSEIAPQPDAASSSHPTALA